MDSLIEKKCNMDFLRSTYRGLLNNSRMYAAFNREEKELFSFVSQNKKCFFDPMSGYGSLREGSLELGLQYYFLEFNPPQYLWQILNLRKNQDVIKKAIQRLLKATYKKLKSSRIVVSENFFTGECIELLKSLYDKIHKAFSEETDIEKNGDLPLALFLPFVGRIACYEEKSDLSIHIKKGGVCVLDGWLRDFKSYLSLINYKISQRKTNQISEEIYIGDARIFNFPDNKFDFMFSSPPYPNGRDYSSFFLLENNILSFDWLTKKNTFIQNFPNRKNIIGSIYTSHDFEEMQNFSSYTQFFERIDKLKLNKQQQYDEDVYYIPYYKKYFYDLFHAYSNIADSLSSDFEGYLIVNNNTHRKIIVPVAEFIYELWEKMGFNVSYYSRKEMFHVGTLNPRARGLSSKHENIIIKISR